MIQVAMLGLMEVEEVVVIHGQHLLPSRRLVTGTRALVILLTFLVRIHGAVEAPIHSGKLTAFET